MLFYERLQGLCEARSIKLTPLLISLKLSAGSIDRWRNGSLPNGETLKKFADYFGVSTDYLLGTEKNEIDPIDAELIQVMQNLTDENKAIFLAQAKFLLSQQSK